MVMRLGFWGVFFWFGGKGGGCGGLYLMIAGWLAGHGFRWSGGCKCRKGSGWLRGGIGYV